MKKLVYYAILVSPIVVYAFIYSQLPAQIPIHYNLDFQPDMYAPKFVYFFLTALPIILDIILNSTLKLDKNNSNERKLVMIHGIIFFFVGINYLLITILYFQNVQLFTLLITMFGLLFVFLGLNMRRLKPSWYIGIRFPATLNDEVVWTKTHEIGGKLFQAIGVLTIISSIVFISAPTISLIIMLGSLLGATLYLYIYSSSEFKKRHKADNKQ